MRFLLSMLFLLGLPVVHAHTYTDAQRVQQAISRFDKAVDEAFYVREVDRAGLITRAYDRNLATFSTHVNDLGVPALRMLLRASHDAFFFSLQDRYLRKEQLYHGALHARGSASRSDAQLLYGSYIKARRFEDANRLAQAHGFAQARIEAGDGATGLGRPLYRVRDGALQTMHVPIDSGPVLVVVAHPLCHFCRAAVAAIEADPKLRRVFSGSVYWIVPPGEDLEIESVSRWNVEHPGEPMRLVVSKQDWPELHFWGTPAFYFFKDGHLKAQTVGWDDGAKTRILRAAGELGMSR